MKSLCGALLLITLLFGAFSLAQPTASLHVRVLDPSGNPKPRAAIFLQQAGQAAAFPVESSPTGAYSFTGLRLAVDYELRAEFQGWTTAVKTFRVSDANEIVSMELRLLPAIEFRDVSGQAGLDFTLRNGATGHAYQPEIMLGGVAAFDFDNDGCTDIFFANGAALPSLTKTGPEFHNRLYRNDCKGAFQDVTARAGLAGVGYSIGVAAADYDNDGFADLLVTGVKGNTLYRNNGDGTFTDVTKRSGIGAATGKWSISAGWFDYDNDGYLDLFVSNYVAWTPESDIACSTAGQPYYCHPRVYKGLPNQLFHNNRDGTFTDVSERSGIARHIGKGMGVSFGDFNGDGLLDIFVANDSVPNFLFQNMGGGIFREVAIEAGVAYLASGNAVAGMGADFRDFDDDGLEDIAVNAMYFDTFPMFRNGGKPHFFSDYTVASGIAIATRELTGWSMGLFDFDNDGHKDLFQAASHFPGSEPFVHSPAAIPNHVFRNNGSGYFEDVSPLASVDFQRAALYHGAAFADFDNDGRVDAVVTAVNGPARLFRNVSRIPSHWLALKLTGTASNRDSLGARVTITLPTGVKHYNRASTAVGYASSSEPIVRFGLGPYETASEVLVHWPSGRELTLRDVAADRLLRITEPNR